MRSICFVHKDIEDTDCGGVSVLFKTLARGLCERGWRVFTISQKPFASKFGSHIQVPASRSLDDYRSIVANELKQLDLDIVECSSWHYELLEYCKVRDRSIVSIRMDPTAGTLFPDATNLEPGEKELVDKADLRIAVSNFVREDFNSKFGTTEVNVVHNGISPVKSDPLLDYDKFTGGDSLNPLDFNQTSPLNGLAISSFVEDRKINVFWLGKTTLMKGFDQLEGIVKQAGSSKFNWILNMGATPPGILWSPNNLKRLRVASRIPKQDQSKLWSAADVFLATSRAEGFCLALAESLSLGVPVVANKNCKVFQELAEFAEFNLVDMQDPIEVLDTIGAVVSRNESVSFPGYFHASRMINQSEELYSGILQKG